MDVRTRVGLNLQNLRHEAGLSQEALADMAGIDRSYVSHIELGKSSASIDKLSQLAAALEVDISELFVPRC